MDLAEKIHRALYKKSGVASANSDPDFLKGFGAGKEGEADSADAVVEIIREWKRRGEPDEIDPRYGAFKEWKRGYWAARLQRACASVIKKP